MAKKVLVRIEEVIRNVDWEHTATLKIDGIEMKIAYTDVDKKSITFDREKGEGTAMINEWWIIQRGIYHCCL
jgi:hypothetical protein